MGVRLRRMSERELALSCLRQIRRGEREEIEERRAMLRELVNHDLADEVSTCSASDDGGHDAPRTGLGAGIRPP